jgi:hypothetical protein
MPITLKPEQSSKPIDQSQRTEFLFFIALNALALPYSAYQTYVGYNNAVAGNAIGALAIAALSTVLFAAMNFGIRDSRLKGKPHRAQVLMYIIPLALSFFGNFNAFYSTQMRSVLYDREIMAYESTLINTNKNAQGALLASTGVNALKSQVSNYLTSINSQYSQIKGKEGWGKECEKDWIALESYLNQEGSPARMTHLQNDVMGLDRLTAVQNLSNAFMNSIISTRQAQVAPTLAVSDSLYRTVTTSISDAKRNGQIRDEGALILDELVKANNTIGANTDGYLKAIGSDGFAYDYLEPSNETQIGTIKHTIQSAFVKWDNPSATFFSFFLSVIIDLAALLYILVFVPYNKNTRGARVGGPRVI